MITETSTLVVGQLRVAVVRKSIRNLHLGVYPPDGRVRIAAPIGLSDAALRVAVIGRLRWIKRQQEGFERQARESPREMVSGESHYFLGRRFRLRVEEGPGPGGVSIRGRTRLLLRAPVGSPEKQRAHILRRWYRARLRELAAPLIAKWEKVLGVTITAWGIKRMKTKWGSCNAKARRIWLNLELARKPPECLEYVIVHELAHLLAPRHDERFHALMHRHLPGWQAARRLLNASPLASEEWPG
ncbi:MAG: M48 family metallopeptidase [Deltaproteobacteria bacterium]|nr:M48 family metallopeptidase [Deltaproteobacteria bacterium]